MHRTLTALLALTIASTGLTLATVPAVAAGELVKLRLNQAIDKLPVASETRRGYEREKFVHWVDGDGDCQDTRDEVLAAESLVKVTGCDIQRGQWRSYYDGATTRSSTEFDIDHLVPLAEAWDSGAKRWNAPTRQRFANDLRDSRSLVAVTASSNRSKSDRDPSEWMPTLGKCVYIRQWVAVKIRWRLKVNRPEKHALRAKAADCKNSTIQVRRAVVALGSASADSGGGDAGGSSGGSAGLDPRFTYCYEAKAAGYGPYYKGRDTEYDWYTDSDNDGVVCE